MNVSELMSRQVVTCRPEDALQRVAELMWNRDCGFIVVVDEAQQPAGVLTDRDICMAAWSQGRTLHDIQAGQAMARTVVTCTPDDPLESLHERARQHQLHRIVVVDADGRLTGVVAIADLSRAAAANKGNSAANELLKTLAAVKRSRSEPATIVPAKPKTEPAKRTVKKAAAPKAKATPKKAARKSAKKAGSRK
jgi:CBS domain-containing protein